MIKHKYDRVTEEEVLYLKDWYSNQKLEDTVIQIIEKNPIYFGRSIDLCRDKIKQINSIVIISCCKSKDAKKSFVIYFEKYIHSIQDLIIFLDTVKRYRGFGKTIRTIVYKWFKNNRNLEKELFSNEGNTSWTNRDILNKFHIKPWNANVSKMLRFFVEKEKANG